MKKIATLIGALLVIGQVSLAGSIGVGYGVTTPIFHNDENDYILPFVDLEYNRFFLKGGSSYGLSFGYKVLEEDNYVLSLYGVPFGGYKLDSSDMDSGYKTIDDRDTKFMGGAEIVYYPGYFDIVTSLSAKYGSEGGDINFRISKPYYITSRLTITPAVTYTYYSSDFVDYYFGVEPHELNKDKLRETYDGDAGYSYGVGLLGNYQLTNSFSVVGFTGVTKLSSEMSNSPLVDNDVIYIFGTGIVYTF